MKKKKDIRTEIQSSISNPAAGTEILHLSDGDAIDLKLKKEEDVKKLFANLQQRFNSNGPVITLMKNKKPTWIVEQAGPPAPSPLDEFNAMNPERPKGSVTTRRRAFDPEELDAE